MSEDNGTTAVAEAPPVKKGKKKTAKKTAAKKAPAKKAAAKKNAGGEGRKGRTSAYAGKKIYRLKKTEETGLRADGNVRTCWNSIKDGIKFETYRENTGMASFARKALADFIAKGYCEVRD